MRSVVRTPSHGCGFDSDANLEFKRRNMNLNNDFEPFTQVLFISELWQVTVLGTSIVYNWQYSHSVL